MSDGISDSSDIDYGTKEVTLSELDGTLLKKPVTVRVTEYSRDYWVYNYDLGVRFWLNDLRNLGKALKEEMERSLRQHRPELRKVKAIVENLESHLP